MHAWGKEAGERRWRKKCEPTKKKYETKFIYTFELNTHTIYRFSLQHWKCVQSRMWVSGKRILFFLFILCSQQKFSLVLFRCISLRSLLSFFSILSGACARSFVKRMRIAFAWNVKCHTHIYRGNQPLHWHWQHRRRRSRDSHRLS